MRSTATASRRSIACARRARKLSPRLIQHQFSYYTEINLLTALGRTKEARNLLESRGPIPHRRGAQALALDRADAPVGRRGRAQAVGDECRSTIAARSRTLEIDDSELHERMRKGLSMTAGADLLLLCAWCYAHRGEHDDARFAYRQAKDREGSHRLDVAMPKLAEWIERVPKDHPDLDAPDVDE